MAQNPLQMIQAYREFSRNFTPQTAEQKVRELVASGKMSQQQLNKFQKDANDFMQILNKFS